MTDVKIPPYRFPKWEMRTELWEGAFGPEVRKVSRYNEQLYLLLIAVAEAAYRYVKSTTPRGELFVMLGDALNNLYQTEEPQFWASAEKKKEESLKPLYQCPCEGKKKAAWDPGTGHLYPYAPCERCKGKGWVTE